MKKLERQFAKRLDDLEKEFLGKYMQYLDRVIYLPHVFDAKQVSTVQLPLHGALAKLLTDYSHEVFAIGQAHGDILCREAHKKHAPFKLADWQPSFQLGTIGYDAENFWLKPEAALKSLEARAILLAGDVEADILAGVKKTLLDHLHGATRQETEQALAKLLDQNMNRARLITTTETTYAYNRGRLSSFHGNGVDYVQFSAVMDMRTSSQCRSRHGKVMRLDSPELANNIPPLHGRCRSILTPIFSVYQPNLVTPETTDWSKTAPLPKGWRMDKKVFTTDIQSDIKKVKDTLSFTPSSTVAEAQKWAVDHNIATNVSYKGIVSRNVQVVNEWNQGVYEAQRKFPELRLNFDFIGTCQERNKYINQQCFDVYLKALRERNPNASEEVLRIFTEKHAPKMKPIPAETYAQSYSGKHGKGISINQVWGNNIDRFQAALKNDVRSRFHPVGCDSIKSVVDHEIGHQIDDLLHLSKREDIKDLFYGSKTRTLTIQRMKEIEEGLSRYAFDNQSTEKIREFVAEAWGEYCNNPNPRAIAKEIGAIAERVYQDGHY